MTMPRVAWVHPVIAHYRVAIINRVAAHPEIDLVNFAGAARKGVSVDDASVNVTTPIQWMHNLRPPGRDARVVYAVGWTQILTGGFDVVITTEAVHNLVNWLLMAFRKLFAYRVVVMGHVRPGRENSRVGTWLRQRLIRSADGIIAYTAAGADQAVAWGVLPDRVAVMGNTLDLDRIERARASAQSPYQTGSRSRIGHDGVRLLFVGRPTAIKRPDVAISTVLELNRRGVGATLTIIGDSAERAELTAQANHSPNIRFTGAIFDEARLEAYFATSDFVFIPGAVGLSVVHAFAYGIPLITSKGVPHGPEMAVARDGVNSVMAESCDTQSFARLISQLAADPQRVAALKQGAAATQLNSPDAMTAEIVRMLIKVANA